LTRGRLVPCGSPCGFGPARRSLEWAGSAAARWSWDADHPTGKGTDTLPGGRWLFVPIRTVRGPVGVLGVLPLKETKELSSADRRLLDAVGHQAAIAIERMTLAADIDKARLGEERERLRSAMLTSVSHDLRTPLASIIGALSSLKSYRDRYDQSTRDDLLGTALSEAERLDRFVGNLLDMTRLDAGAIVPNREPVDAGDLVSTALRRAAPLLKDQVVVPSVAPDLPPLSLDFVLAEQALFNLLDNAGKYSPFYQELFAKHRVDIRTINTLRDLSRIPATSKEELQQRSEDFLCVSRDKIIEYTSTSGTLGSPVTIALTEKDLNRLASNEYNSFLIADGSAEDIYQLMLTLDRQFMAGIAYYSGIRKLGAGIIRLGPGVPSLQWETIQRLKPTTIVVVPSFILKLIQFAKDNLIDINRSSVKKAICIGENIRNTDFSLNILGKKITESWDIHLYSTYASTEMQTAFTECAEGKGGHYQPELVIVELLDENDKPPVSSPG